MQLYKLQEFEYGMKSLIVRFMCLKNLPLAFSDTGFFICFAFILFLWTTATLKKNLNF